MITEKDLQEAIAECQGTRNPTAATCTKLAAYLTIQDHLFPADSKRSHSFSAASPAPVISPAPVMPAMSFAGGESEFLRAANGKDYGAVLSVMDELMETLRAVNPRLYEGVMTKMLQ